MAPLQGFIFFGTGKTQGVALGWDARPLGGRGAALSQVLGVGANRSLRLLMRNCGAICAGVIPEVSGAHHVL